MPRSFVIGDIHGNYSPMIKLFKAVKFDYENDHLISLGDLVDRGPEPVKVVDELMKLRNFVFVLGNHDQFCFEYLKSGIRPVEWILQGGQSTLNDYEKNKEARSRHLEFFASADFYHIDNSNRLFVHAGFDGSRPFTEQKHETMSLLWNRSLYMTAAEYNEDGRIFKEFSEIYIGHSPTQLIMKQQPTRLANLWMMDTGAGHRRFLSLMDLNTKEYWQVKCDF